MATGSLGSFFGTWFPGQSNGRGETQAWTVLFSSRRTAAMLPSQVIGACTPQCPLGDALYAWLRVAARAIGRLIFVTASAILRPPSGHRAWSLQPGDRWISAIGPKEGAPRCVGYGSTFASS